MLFFQLINARHERASTVLTSNKGFEEWRGVLGDEVMAAALIDRLVHHCHIVNIRGNSYPMRDHQNLLQSGADRRRKRAAGVTAAHIRNGVDRPLWITGLSCQTRGGRCVNSVTPQLHRVRLPRHRVWGYDPTPKVCNFRLVKVRNFQLGLTQTRRACCNRVRQRSRSAQKVGAKLQRNRLDKERSHLVNALEALKNREESDSDLEKRLSMLDEAIRQNDYRTANIRAGYVYVISNRGAFGTNVVKIGLTRRLEPMDRVSELGDASVPFRFDVHSLFFSEDAVSLESGLHRHFEDRRVNHVNTRKEFFFATPAEVREALASKVGSLLEFTEPS